MGSFIGGSIGMGISVISGGLLWKMAVIGAGIGAFIGILVVLADDDEMGCNRTRPVVYTPNAPDDLLHKEEKIYPTKVQNVKVQSTMYSV